MHVLMARYVGFKPNVDDAARPSSSPAVNSPEEIERLASMLGGFRS